MESIEQLRVEIQRSVAAALAEDIGTGDLTARLIPNASEARGRVITREDAVLCGSDWFNAAFETLDPTATILWHAKDGDRVEAGQTLCDVVAGARALLTAERAALNFLQLLSGTATLTRRYVETVAGTRAKIVDTRKTLPGLRLAQKYAVGIGGGTNHRIGLYDGILIKENHIIAAGGVAEVLAEAQRIAPSNVFIEIEVETLEQLGAALDAGARMILLDNMTLDQMAEAVRLTDGKAELEASGGVSLDRVRAIAETGVDRISIGGLTKDVRAIDLSLRHIED
ncbi:MULTISPECIES: carboxylating nicotinate-nucleotide diphosphorylase [Denitromonas]|jgi:nicotinate-nucleotide pyrophosphorylase (carboxylating)|uniref:nicotinate-nucleotide diphosphorylase (carboxylating) n=2 Tax=Denitromonas TaxID=139331 RepID=A0ABY3F162_9RHOO|nr:MULTISPECIES: carboxylating nicotinate-nucleotide diphosphorylase [Denitromonas]TVO53136.1 carboxylating nicotinate-nucleotide diphosphorylase [Denitromonas halophila]TVO65967.1 carboxylating nicotinate-nucleotide diphosphorylase [Denitromonas ohlonensis]TVO79560.1 carboxylating nicotinate-nucleotide diphosphorylase [Denitromonas ohlonensis]TVT49851.1 MAG: carboxylating nicotinate-nucleotide diphosphorylase [Denitromonas halophila]TVT67593.1 MAG: carboxylating nicotinate-nucleotide diphosph